MAVAPYGGAPYPAGGGTKGGVAWAGADEEVDVTADCCWVPYTLAA